MRMILKASALLWVLLVASMVYAGLAEEIVGAWTLVDSVETGEPPIIVTFNADGTYVMEAAMLGARMPLEEGTYVVSGTELILHSEEGEIRLENVTVAGDQLRGYDPEEDETVTLQRGAILPEPAGTGSISGTISYDGEVSSMITVIVFAGDFMDQEEDEAMPLGIAVLTQPGPYTIEGLADGEYAVAAMLGSLDQDPDAFGFYGLVPCQL